MERMGATDGDVQHLVQLSSNEPGPCEECDDWHWSLDYSIIEHANHYISAHGYRVLHVGQETSRNDDGLWHSTVIVLATSDGSNAERIAAQRRQAKPEPQERYGLK
jgi:hypothetical protein